MSLPLYFRAALVVVLLAGASPARAVEPATPAHDPTPAQSTPPQSHWDFVDGDSVPIEIRTREWRPDVLGRSVTIGATVNGKHGTFLIDTGAGMIVLSPSFAEGIDLSELGATTIRGIGGNTIPGKRALVRDFALGRSVLHDVAVTVSKTSDTTVDGIIGYPVFAKAIVDVDLAAGHASFSDPVRFAPTIGRTSYVFDIDLDGGSPTIAGTIGNGVPIHPIFDTGNSDLLTLSHKLRDDGKVVTLPGTALVFQGVDGATGVIGCSHVNHVAFGKIRYEGSIVCFAPGFGTDGGIVGMDFLRHFDWTIDYLDKKFVLTPNGL